MKHIAIVMAVIGCTSDPGESPKIDIESLMQLSDGTIAYRANGTFLTSISVDADTFKNSTRATVEVITSAIVAGATTTATVVLDDDGAGHLGGTATLNWPPGGELELAVGIAGQRTRVPIKLEKPTLVLSNRAPSDNGSQTTVSICADSSGSDGTVAVRLDGAMFKESGVVEGTVPLVLGACSGTTSPIDDPFTHARFSVVATQSTIDVLASLPNTGESKELSITINPVEPITLQISGPMNAAPLSIVELDVRADRGGPAKGIALAFQSTPALTFVPATATTDENGDALIHFQMPESGEVFIQVRAGTATDSITVR